MWGFALAQRRKQLQDVFPSFPPLVNSQPLPNCRDHGLKLEAHTTCTADWIFPSWCSSTHEEFSPPQNSPTTKQALSEHLPCVLHCTLITKGEVKQSLTYQSSATYMTLIFSCPAWITLTSPTCEVGINKLHLKRLLSRLNRTRVEEC